MILCLYKRGKKAPCWCCNTVTYFHWLSFHPLTWCTVLHDKLNLTYMNRCFQTGSNKRYLPLSPTSAFCGSITSLFHQTPPEAHLWRNICIFITICRCTLQVISKQGEEIDTMQEKQHTFSKVHQTSCDFMLACPFHAWIFFNLLSPETLEANWLSSG